MHSDFCVAVHALVYLRHKRCLLSSEELAENIRTNPARVRKVMARLRAAGLIEAREGAVGGYRAREDTGALTLDRVAAALGTEPVELGWHSGSREIGCRVSAGMADAMDGLVAELNAACRERLHKHTIEELERALLAERQEENT
jgi:DNA-binding IscR family transcriptional regulator